MLFPTCLGISLRYVWLVKVYDPRAALDQAITSGGHNYAALSRMLGRNAAYLQQFVKRGTPSRLNERDRRILSGYLGLDEVELGAPVPASGSTRLVARLDVRASAGPGAFSDQEQELPQIGFDRAWLKQISKGRDAELSIIRVDGDSMAPTLNDGDDILVDCSVDARQSHEGIFVLRRDDTLSVKRLSVNPATGLVTIASDNPAHPTWHDCSPETIALVGRVIWAGRRLA